MAICAVHNKRPTYSETRNEVFGFPLYIITIRLLVCLNVDYNYAEKSKYFERRHKTNFVAFHLIVCHYYVFRRIYLLPNAPRQPSLGPQTKFSFPLNILTRTSIHFRPEFQMRERWMCALAMLAVDVQWHTRTHTHIYNSGSGSWTIFQLGLFLGQSRYGRHWNRV